MAISSDIQVVIKATAARRIITAGPGLSDTDAWAVLPDGPLGIGGNEIDEELASRRVRRKHPWARRRSSESPNKTRSKGCFPVEFPQEEGLRQLLTGLRRGPGSRTHQIVAAFGGGGVGLLRSHLIGAAEGSRCREYGLKKDVWRIASSPQWVQRSCRCKQRVLGISYPDSAKMREAEVPALLH